MRIAVDFFAGAGSSYIDDVVVMDGKIYYAAAGCEGPMGPDMKLWVFDPGSETALVAAEIVPGTTGSWPFDVVELGGKLYFTSEVGAGQELIEGLERVTEALSELQVDEGLLIALRRGANVLAEGRQPLIYETPHLFVCRTCGYLALAAPPDKCRNCSACGWTFQWFSPVYWMEALNPTEALQRLCKTPLEVTALLEGLSDEAMNWPAVDGGWGIRTAISHLRDAQEEIAYRIELFMEEENPMLEMKAVWT